MVKKESVKRVFSDEEKGKLKRGYLTGKFEGKEAARAKYFHAESIDVDQKYGPIEPGEDYGAFREKARNSSGGDYSHASELYGDRLIHADTADARYLGEAQGYANALMNFAQKTGDLKTGLHAARLYEKLGQGSRVSVHRRLDRVAKKAEESGWYDKMAGGHMGKQHFLGNVALFKEKNPIRTTLEEKTAAISSLIGLMAGLFLLSPNLTGNIIGNLDKNSGSIIGIILFLFGILAAIFYFRKR